METQQRRPQRPAFMLGTHQPGWLATAGVSLFVPIGVGAATGTCPRLPRRGRWTRDSQHAVNTPTCVGSQ